MRFDWYCIYSILSPSTLERPKDVVDKTIFGLKAESKIEKKW
jgi:hypothetical protein